MVKPVDYQQFVDVIRTIDAYWTLSELPDGVKDYEQTTIQSSAD